MTWDEFKQKIEAEGVNGDTEIVSIDVINPEKLWIVNNRSGLLVKDSDPLAFLGDIING